MTGDEIAYQSLLVAKESARWAYYSLWVYGVTAFIGIVTAFVTLWALLVARKGLSTWKEQHISIAKAEWIASLVSYMGGLSYLPHTVNWNVDSDKIHIEKIAELQYECVKRWKILQMHLSQNPKLEREFKEKYEAEWVNFGMTAHNAYMGGDMTRRQLKEVCVKLYNL